MFRRSAFETYIAGCDTCDKKQTFIASNFSLAIIEAKKAGWSLRQLHGDWFHYCPDIEKHREMKNSCYKN